MPTYRRRRSPHLHVFTAIQCRSRHARVEAYFISELILAHKAVKKFTCYLCMAHYRIVQSAHL